MLMMYKDKVCILYKHYLSFLNMLGRVMLNLC